MKESNTAFPLLLLLLLLLLLKAVHFVPNQNMQNTTDYLSPSSLMLPQHLYRNSTGNVSFSLRKSLLKALFYTEMSVQNQWKIDGIHDCLSPRVNDCCRFAYVSASTKIHKKSFFQLQERRRTSSKKKREFKRGQRIQIPGKLCSAGAVRWIFERRLGERSVKVNHKVANKNGGIYHMTAKPIKQGARVI